MERVTARSVPFEPTVHDAQSFDCGHAGMNTWLLRHADRARRMGTAHTFVLARGDRVLAYHSLVASSVAKESVPNSLAHGSPETVPAWLVARLAVDLSEQGKGTGHATLLDALGRLALASSRGPAARLVVVDAVDGRAFRFYEKFGFVPAPRHGDRLFMKMSTVRGMFTPG